MAMKTDMDESAAKGAPVQTRTIKPLREASMPAEIMIDSERKHNDSNHGSSGISETQIDGEVQIANVVGDKQEENANGTPPAVKRTIGPLRGATMIAGTMIGSGVLITTRGVLRGTGSVDACLCVWVGCGVISILSALCYAELSTMIRLAGGEYGYLLRAYGGFTRFLGPMPAFLHVWSFVLLVVPSRLAVISQAMAEYITYPLFDACGAPDFIKKMLAVACIVGITAVNCASTKASLAVQNIFTSAKFLALAIICVGGIVKLAEGNVSSFSAGFSGTIQSPSAFAVAFYNGLFAYVGWNSVILVTEEIKDPERNIPLAIVIAVPMVTLLYLLVNLSYFTVVTIDELVHTPAIGVLWGNHVLGVMTWIMPVTVALAKIGACNGVILSSSRAVFTPARKGHMPSMLASTHISRSTPVAPLILNAIITTCLIISNSIPTMINFYSFTSWLFNGLVFLSLIVMRVTMKDLNRPFKVPLPIPILCLLISGYLVIAPLVESPTVFLSAFISAIGGVLLYVPFVFFQLRIPGLEYITAFVLVFLESAPSK